MFISKNGGLTRDQYDFVINQLERSVSALAKINNEFNMMKMGVEIDWKFRYGDPNRNPCQDILKQAMLVFKNAISETKTDYEIYSDENDILIECDKNLIENHAKNLLENEAAKNALEFHRDIFKG